MAQSKDDSIEAWAKVATEVMEEVSATMPEAVWEKIKPMIVAAEAQQATCTVEGDDRPAYAFGLCKMHYAHWRRLQSN